jgi:hypothetical protein
MPIPLINSKYKLSKLVDHYYAEQVANAMFMSKILEYATFTGDVNLLDLIQRELEERQDSLNKFMNNEENKEV